MSNSYSIKTLKKRKGRRLIQDNYQISEGYSSFRKLNKLLSLKCISAFNINEDLYKKIEQTLMEKYKKEMLDIGISKSIFKNPNIKIQDMKIETTIDEKKVINITALADVDEIVNVDGKDYYYNMLVPFSIIKIGIKDGTDCPSFE